MKILVFEYITGGGFNQQELPEFLIGEGRLMLNEVLACFSRIANIELTVMLDWRVSSFINTVGIRTVNITPEANTLNEFAGLADQCDAVWPIAPEFDGILHSLCRQVELLNKILLTSPATAVTIAANKFKTYEQLSRHQIATVATRLYEPGLYLSGEWLVKPVDGAGCLNSYLINGRQDFFEVSKKLPDKSQYIIQPHIHGKKTSLSCLFKQGRGWLLCANLQHFKLIARQYHLIEIVVNHNSDFSRYEGLVNDLARAFPDLWGYAGIDLIETAEAINVLEINPRLTTSFVGIQAALGINTCCCVLDLLKGKPIFKPQFNRSVTIKIKQDHYEG